MKRKTLLILIITLLLIASCQGQPAQPALTQPLLSPTPLQPSPLAATPTWMATATATFTPTGKTIPALPTGTPTPTATAAFRIVQVPIPDEDVIMSLDGLIPGAYFIFWRENNWYLQNIEAQTPLGRFLPIASLHPELIFSSDRTRVAFSTTDSDLGVYDLQTNSLLIFSRPWGLNWIDEIFWSGNDQTIYLGLCSAAFDCGTHLGNPEQGIYAVQLQEKRMVRLLDGTGKDKRFGRGVLSRGLVRNNAWMLIEVPLGPPGVRNYYLMNLVCLANPATCPDQIEEVGRYEWLGRGAEENLILVKCPETIAGVVCELDVSKQGALPNTVIAATTFPDTSFRESGNQIRFQAWSPDGKYFVVEVASKIGETDQDGVIHYLYDIYLVLANEEVARNLTQTEDIEEHFVAWVMIE